MFHHEVVYVYSRHLYHYVYVILKVYMNVYMHTYIYIHANLCVYG